MFGKKRKQVTVEDIRDFCSWNWDQAKYLMEGVVTEETYILRGEREAYGIVIAEADDLTVEELLKYCEYEAKITKKQSKQNVQVLYMAWTITEPNKEVARLNAIIQIAKWKGQARAYKKIVAFIKGK